MMDYYKRFISLSLLFIALFSAPVTLYAADQSLSKETVEVSELITVNINQATAEEIAAGLKGIGLKKAQAIVEWRKLNGNFAAPEQLLNVKGVGEKTLKLNRLNITI